MEITLRPYQISDIDEFMQWACNSQVLQYIYMQFWINPNSTREDVLSYFEKRVITHPWHKAICLQGRAIGFVAIERQAGKHGLDRGRAQLSYALGREYWGRGIATIAVRMAVSFAFHEVQNLVRIEAFVDVPNKASERVLQKVGFVKEGVLRNYIMVDDGVGLDVCIYSILPTDSILN
ncbi:unnamed protein product [Amaranthus hypochondriacus]